MAKGTKIPPQAIPYKLDQPGANPGIWPPTNWQKPLTAQQCEPTNPSVLTEEYLNGSWPVGTEIGTKVPLSYLKKPQTQGLLSDGGGWLMNRFVLPNDQCVGANKVLLFITGAAVATGDVPGGACTEEWANRVYAEFDSSKEQYLSTPPADDGPAGFIVDDCTFSAWIRPKALQTWAGDYDWIASTGYEYPAPEENWRWNLYITNDAELAASMTGELGQDSPNGKVYSTIATLTTHQWYHTAFTWNSSSQDLTLYINGVSQSVDKVVDYPVNTAQYPGNLTVGARPINLKGLNTYHFSGSMDEISFWNTDLSAAEVLEISSSAQYCGDGPSNLNMHSKKDNLVSWWRMGELVYGGSSDFIWGCSPIIPDIAKGISAADWPGECGPGGAPCIGNGLCVPTDVPDTFAPTFQSEDYLSGALASVGSYVDNPPWIAVTGAFANGNENIVMLPGARVELTWNPFPLTKPGDPPHPNVYWSTDLMHSGCYSCNTLGPKAYLTGAIADDAPAWPPP